jgi:hypothetical protein
MSDLDRWARDHKHRILREKIAKIRASRGGLWSGVIASGAIGWAHVASGQLANSSVLCSGCVSSGAISFTPIDWGKVNAAIGAG